MNNIDWNGLWKEKNCVAGNDNSVEFWDAFAPRYKKKVKGDDHYASEFYRLAEIQQGETLFDMGCGSGPLAIPFAKKGHHVYAADFSQGMLDTLVSCAREEGVEELIHPIKLDWNEDWSLRDLPKCDVAFSSRAMICENLTEALKKLESVAKRRCCVATWDNPAIGYDRHVANALGYERPGQGSYFYVINELIDRDVFPELLFLKSPFRASKYDSFEAGVKKLRGGFTRGLTEEQDEAFADYCKEHLKFNSEKGFWQLDHDTMSTTAFIRWDKENVYGKIK